ncbi:hypothetical protein V6O07_02130, partial [Arthrospira platensis SPKY2]
DEGLTIFTTEGSFPIPIGYESKYDEVVVKGWQEPPIGLTSNSITYVYIRYIDQQVVADVTLPSPLEGILIATVITDDVRVTSIINHYPLLPNMSELPDVPGEQEEPEEPEPIFGDIIYHSISVSLERPREKEYTIDLDAYPSYRIHSLTYLSKFGIGEMNIFRNSSIIPGLDSLFIDDAKRTVNINNTNNLLNNGDKLSVDIYSSQSLEDLSLTFRVSSLVTNVIPI